LLSFAQFEREVTGERIRDKIAASKRKGLWMGGLVPVGYQAKGRTLEPEEPTPAGSARSLSCTSSSMACASSAKNCRPVAG